MDDKRIIELFFQRSEDAIGQLDSKYGALFRKTASSFLGDRRDAEECVNDAYLGVWCTIPPKRPENLASYVLKIVRNTAVKRYHSNTAKKRNSFYDTALDELEGCFASTDDVSHSLELKECVEGINTFLSFLDKDSRIMFVKRYYYAESVAEIAGEMQKSAHYVSVKLHRIREKLRKYLIERGIYL